jgi:hypothetical protein
MTQSDRFKCPLKQTLRVIIASVHVIVSLVTHKNTTNLSFILIQNHNKHFAYFNLAHSDCLKK